jgi:phenylacetate-CoA ligase
MRKSKIPNIPKGFKNINWLESNLKNKPEEFWIKRGENRALQLFRLMSQRVPAYKDFLNKNKLNPKNIKTIKDFKKIPAINKDNYLRKYPLESLCWDGKLKEKSWTICSTSGSSGEPYYFPHDVYQDLQYSIVAELYLRTNFHIQKKSTLYIIGFIMGTWLGGVFTYSAVQMLTKSDDYNISVITPGTNKMGIINAVKKLGDKYDQIIIGSYAPFLKDVLDDGARLGLNWRKYNLGFIFSAEGFSEGLRDYILKVSGSNNIYTDTLNHYGTVDLGTMSYETPISILARRRALGNKKLYKELFSETVKLPTFTQYIPELFYFEEVDKTVICSAFSGLPLVRYSLKDYGGIHNFDETEELFKKYNIDIINEAKNNGISNTVWNLPFVYVFERKDFMVKFYLCDIYPETIKKALQNSAIEKYVTGKFTMMIKFDTKNNQYLEINTEVKNRIKKTSRLKSKIIKCVTNKLLEENSGYRDVYERIGKRAVPRIVLWKYEHPKFFKPGGKQKWVVK